MERDLLKPYAERVCREVWGNSWNTAEDPGFLRLEAALQALHRTCEARPEAPVDTEGASMLLRSTFGVLDVALAPPCDKCKKYKATGETRASRTPLCDKCGHGLVRIPFPWAELVRLENS
jgi:hypothetical protein